MEEENSRQSNENEISESAAARIKALARMQKIKEFVTSEHAADKAEMIGKHGVRGFTAAAGLVVKYTLKAISSVLRFMVKILGVWFIAVIIIFCIMVPVIGAIQAAAIEEEASDEETEEFYDNQAEAGDIRTSLTYKEVSESSYYSHWAGDNGSPFRGDNGLDKINGDRGGNCTAYAWGRRCEIEGQRTQLGAWGDAYYWYDREAAAGIYECGQTARAGAVCCWSYGYNKYGHVAVIEKINEDGSIVTSNSAYGSHTGVPILFYLTTYESEKALKSAYPEFEGYIYAEKITDDASSETTETENTDESTAEKTKD